MNKDQALNDEERELLQQLANLLYPGGGLVFDFEGEHLPAIAPKFKGIVTKPFYIDVADPIIKRLAGRAIASGIGAEVVNHGTLTIQSNLIDVDKPEAGVNTTKSLKAGHGPDRPIFEYMYIWYITLKRDKIFKQLNYSDAAIESGLWDYLNGDQSFLIVCVERWAYPGGAKRKEPDLMDQMVQFDSTARSDWAQWLGIRRPFHGVEKIRWIDDIISGKEKIIGRALTPKERLQVLKNEGEYIYLNGETGTVHFVSDRGEFSVSVAPNILNTVPPEDRRRYLEERLKSPELFDSDQVINELKKELAEIDLYQGAFKTMQICVCYYYQQGRKKDFKDVLLIPKEDVKTWTGEDGKNGYRTFKRWLYALYNTSITIKNDNRRVTEARLIYQIDEDQKYYRISFNKNIFPVTREIVEHGMQANPEILKDRRYFLLPPRILAEKLTDQAAYYINWIISESGNNQKAGVPENQKAVVFPGATHCQNANIQQKHSSQKMRQMLKIWRELLQKEIIFKVEPCIESLGKLAPRAFEKTQVCVYARKDNSELNEFLKQKNQAAARRKQ